MARLLPKLRAIDALGGSGANAAINGLVVELAGTSAEQLATEFEPEPSRTCPKIRRSVAWSWSLLGRADLAESIPPEVWGVTSQGNAVFEACLS